MGAGQLSQGQQEAPERGWDLQVENAALPSVDAKDEMQQVENKKAPAKKWWKPQFGSRSQHTPAMGAGAGAEPSSPDEADEVMAFKEGADPLDTEERGWDLEVDAPKGPPKVGISCSES